MIEQAGGNDLILSFFFNKIDPEYITWNMAWLMGPI